MKVTIGITTFSKRFDMVSTLIKQIRTQTQDPIIVGINGEEGGNFNNDYRKQMLELCAAYDDIYPIFFIEMRGLAKLWNTIVNTSTTNEVLLLNDDVEIVGKKVFDNIYGYLASGDLDGITRINHSFSHFLLKKDVINKIGYFDERLLGFGEEDGDIYYRFIKNNMSIKGVNIEGIINLVSNVVQDHVKKGIGKYSLWNREYIYGQKYHVDFSSPYRGLFDTPMRQVIEDVNCYPLELYHMTKKGDV